MPDKKPTDNEIIKALEYCSKQGITSECEKCKVKKGCRSALIENALDLINRQKAEIENLKTHNAVLKMANELCKGWEERAKAEAIKEVTAELYNSFAQYETYDRLHTFEILDRINSVEECLLNNLVKEKTGTDFTQMFMGTDKLKPLPSIDVKEMVGDNK